MLVSIIGDVRQGKTLLGSLLAISSNREVYANFTLLIPNYKDLQPKDLVDLPNNVLVIIDEAYSWLESRKSGKDLNVFASNILFQSGKRTIDIILITQLFSAVDIRFRNMSNVLIEAQFNVAMEYFHYDTYIKYKGVFEYANTQIIDYNDVKEYFKYFDTYQIIDSDIKEKYELDIIENDTAKLIPYIKKIAKNINKDLKGIYTHDNIKLTMLENNYSIKVVKKFEKYVYMYFKKLIRNHIK